MRHLATGDPLAMFMLEHQRAAYFVVTGDPGDGFAGLRGRAPPRALPEIRIRNVPAGVMNTMANGRFLLALLQLNYDTPGDDIAKYLRTAEDQTLRTAAAVFDIRAHPSQKNHCAPNSWTA